MDRMTLNWEPIPGTLGGNIPWNGMPVHVFGSKEETREPRGYPFEHGDNTQVVT